MHEKCPLFTSTKPATGLESLEDLKHEFPSASFVYHQLELTNFTSRSELIDYIKHHYTQIDLMINNAGMAFKVASQAPFSEQVETTNTANYYGTKSLIVEMLADNIFHTNSRVLICSSMCSDTSFAQCSKAVKNVISKSESSGEAISENPLKSVEQLDEIVEDFINCAEEGTHAEKYSNSAYGMSKLFLRKLAQILAINHPNIRWFSYCPGWCKTDMAGYEKPPKTAEEGSQITYWLATSNDQVIVQNNGGYFRDNNQLRQWGFTS